MSVGLFLRCFCGFALQLVPCAILLLLPFQKNAFQSGRRHAFVLLIGVSLVLSLCYPLNVWRSMRLAENSNLDDNLFMLASVIAVSAVFITVTNESLIRKLTALFVVIGYAAVQFFLSNMLMDFLPLAKQDLIYSDATLAAYLIVTALLLPAAALFLCRRLKAYLVTLEQTGQIQTELIFLAAVFVLYLALNALYGALWVRLRDAHQLSFAYYIPFSLFLSVLLIVTFYFTINLSVFKARNAEQALELALMRQNYDHVEESMQQQRRALHDTRQLLRNISAIAKDATREELLHYLDEAMDYTSVSTTCFCENPCVNGLLGYYAELAEGQGVGFSARAVCGQLPFSDADLTILFSNVLDNAIRAAVEFGRANPPLRPEIRLTADTVKDQFAVQVENSCLSVSYSPAFSLGSGADQKGWLPSEAFLSTRRGGYGLRRMERIAGKYNGHIWFSFNADSHLFFTRAMLPLSEV